MSRIDQTHTRKAPVRSVVPHMVPRHVDTMSAALPGCYSSSESVASSWQVRTARRKSSGETLEALLPFAKWGVAVLLLALGGFGVSKLLASSGTSLNVETHSVQIKVLLNNKPAPGAAITLTPVLTEEQTKALEGDLAAGMQLVGHGKLGNDSTCSPSLASSDKPGLPAGEYIASLSWCKVEVKDGETVAGPDLVPQVFRCPSTSTLRVKVAEGSNSPVTLQVVDPKVRARVLNYDPE